VLFALLLAWIRGFQGAVAADNTSCVPVSVPGKTGDVSDVLIVPKGMGLMDWVRDSWHQSRIVPPRRDLRRLASVQAVTRLSRLYLPGGTIPFFPPRLEDHYSQELTPARCGHHG